jgi:hypothetical protein
VAALCAFALFSLTDASAFARRIGKHDLGFADPRFRDSPLLQEARSIPRGSAIYTNMPWPVWIHVREPGVRWLPVAAYGADLRPDPDFEWNLESMLEEMTEHGAYVIYFRRTSLYEHFVPIETVLERIPCEIVYQSAEGLIVRPRKLP